MNQGLSQVAAVVGVGHTDWRGDHARVRAGGKPRDSVGYGALAFKEALADAGLKVADIDGLIVGPTTPYERVGEVLGIDARWGGQADALMETIRAKAGGEKRPQFLKVLNDMAIRVEVARQMFHHYNRTGVVKLP